MATAGRGEAGGSTPDEARLSALEAEKDRFRELCDAAFEAIVIHDKGIIVDANQAFVAMFGYDLPEAIGRNALDLAAPESRALVVEKIRSGSEEPYEAMGVRKDGRKFLGLLRGRPIHYQGRLLRVVAISDISERKQLEAQLRLSEQLVSMGALAAGVAHEINNPLTYVLGNLELLGRELEQMRPELPPARLEALLKHAEEALDGTERVRDIVRDLKSLTGDGVEPSLVDLRRVLDSATRIAANEVRHRARLVRQYGDAPPVRGSDLRLAQVFVNLLLNAAQAIADGQVASNEIRVVLRQDEAGWAVVEIRDTGGGIPAEIRAHIFEPFFTTKPGRGTGLGLAISRGIVEQLGGTISAESAERGTLMRVRLPAGRAAPAARAPRPASPVDRKRVLVIDDEPRVAVTIKRLLERDHQVQAVGSIAEAQALIDAGQGFDLIVCDLMMPYGTGMDLHARLSETAPHLARRMLFVTGGAFSAAAEAFLKRPDIRWLEKPFAAAELRQAIAAVDEEGPSRA
jgi:PAS domain S-box-containing protein